MKLSEMETDFALDIICDIAPHVKAIARDKEIQAQLSSLAQLYKGAEKMTMAQMATACMDGLCDMAPMLLRNHRQDIYFILSTTNGVPLDEVARQKLPVTIGQLRELVKDPELKQLFT